jgi:hypothetical protein
VAYLRVCSASHISSGCRRSKPTEVNRSTRNCAIEQTCVKESETKLCGDEQADAALST